MLIMHEGVLYVPTPAFIFTTPGAPLRSATILKISAVSASSALPFTDEPCLALDRKRGNEPKNHRQISSLIFGSSQPVNNFVI